MIMALRRISVYVFSFGEVQIVSKRNLRLSSLEGHFGDSLSKRSPHLASLGVELQNSKVLQTLTSFEFLINQKKSRVIPNQNFIFLGINWFLRGHTWGISQEKKV
jgi:hypothetical protein